MNTLSAVEARVSKAEALFGAAKNVYHGFMSSELLEPIVDKIKERFSERAGDHMAAIADVQFAAIQSRVEKLADASSEIRERTQALATVLAAYKRVVSEQAELKREQRRLEALLKSRFKELYAAREGKNWSYDLADDINNSKNEREPLLKEPANDLNDFGGFDGQPLVGKGAAITSRNYGCERDRPSKATPTGALRELSARNQLEDAEALDVRGFSDLLGADMDADGWAVQWGHDSWAEAVLEQTKDVFGAHPDNALSRRVTEFEGVAPRETFTNSAMDELAGACRARVETRTRPKKLSISEERLLKKLS